MTRIFTDTFFESVQISFIRVVRGLSNYILKQKYSTRMTPMTRIFTDTFFEAVQISVIRVIRGLSNWKRISR